MSEGFEEALKAGRLGWSTEAQKMAMFCDSVVLGLDGKLSPKLVWEGAQKRGLTTKQLLDLAEINREGLRELQEEAEADRRAKELDKFRDELKGLDLDIIEKREQLLRALEELGPNLWKEVE